VFVVMLSVSIVLLTSIAQIILKAGAMHRSGVKVFINAYTLSAYTIFVVVIILSAFLLRAMELKYYPAILSATYVATMLFSAYFFKEMLSKRKIIGTAFVTIGVIVFLLR